MLPNFLVIGAAKAGTTSLYHYLKQHPDIFMSPEKEPRFFATDMITEENCAYTRLDAYEELFSSVKNEKAIGEASGLYMFSKSAPQTIHEMIPDARLVAILRNPADRAYSQYCYWRYEGKENEEEFGKIIEKEMRLLRNGESTQYLGRGLYGQQIERFFKVFKRDHLRVYLHEEFVERPIEVIRDIYSFLNVDDTFKPDLRRAHNVTTVPEKGVKSFVYRILVGSDKLRILVNRMLPPRIYWKYVVPAVRWVKTGLRKSGGRKPEELPEHLRKTLVEFYGDDIRLTERLTGYDLSAWLNT